MRKSPQSYGILALAIISFTTNATNVFASKGYNPDQDSVRSWGPWGEMVSPAAGSPAFSSIHNVSLYIPPEHTPDTHVTSPDIHVPPLELSCPAGSMCGYGRTKTSYSTYEAKNYTRLGHSSPSSHTTIFQASQEPDATAADWHPVNLVTPDTAGMNSSSQSLSFNGTVDGGNFRNQLKHFNGTVYSDWKTDPRNGPSDPSFSPAPNVLCSMTGQNLRNGLTTHFTPQSLHNIIPATLTGTGTVPGFLSDAPNISPLNIRAFYNFNLPDTETTIDTKRQGQIKIDFDTQIIENNFGRDIGVYVINTSSSDATQWNIQGVLDYIKGSSQEFSLSSNIVGTPTTIAQLTTAISAGNVQATYNGFSLSSSGAHQSPVTINVDFGSGTWDGSWNNGADGYVTTSHIVNPNNIVNDNFEIIGTIVDGAVGFNASGAVKGNTFRATNISAVDGIIQGSIDGAFFNVAGDVVAGVADIVKTGFKLSSSQKATTAYDSTTLRYENAQHISTFVAAQEPVSPGP